MKTVHETCSCGATFAYEGEQPLAAAADFRRNHRHAESVGICGDMAPSPLVDDTEIRSFCELKAGHTGAHSDGAGHWFHAETHPIVETEAQV